MVYILIYQTSFDWSMTSYWKVIKSETSLKKITETLTIAYNLNVEDRSKSTRIAPKLFNIISTKRLQIPVYKKTPGFLRYSPKVNLTQKFPRVILKAKLKNPLKSELNYVSINDFDLDEFVDIRWV